MLTIGQMSIRRKIKIMQANRSLLKRVVTVYSGYSFLLLISSLGNGNLLLHLAI